MRGVRGIADEDHIAARPAFALDAPEVEPGGRADEMRSVRLEPMAAQIFGEQPLAHSNGGVLVHRIEAEAPPGLFRTFDDEGRAVGREAIGVRPDPAVLAFLE